jgi:alpha-galactosidase
MLSLLLVATVAVIFQSAHALHTKQDVGRLPALGWNSWNAYRCDINEDKFLSAAQMIVTLGLKVSTGPGPLAPRPES